MSDEPRIATVFGSTASLENNMQSALAMTSVLLRLARGLALVASVAAVMAPCGAAEDQTIVPPPGDYKMVEVVLEKGHPQQGDLVLRGGIRDGKLMIRDSTSVRLKAGELVFTADAVKGEFGWRTPPRARTRGRPMR